MSHFNDINGRAWKISLDGILLKELRDAHKIDLADAANSTYSQLKRDPATLTVALAFLCADQLKEVNLTPRDFAKLVTGAALESAFTALWGAAENFFPPSLWSVLSTRFKSEQAIEENWAKMRPQVEVFNQPGIPAELKEQVWAVLGDILRNSGLPTLAAASSVSGLGEIRLNAASTSPASAESTPAA